MNHENEFEKNFQKLSIENEFVGRQEALNAFYDRFAYRHMKNAIYFYSMGGFGKTWLLRKIFFDLENDPYRKVTPIIDFFDTYNHTVFGLQQSIRQRLEESIQDYDAFNPYEDVLKELELVRNNNTADETGILSNLENRRDKIFIECCNEIILGHEVVLLFDTFERTQTLFSGRWLLKEFLPNTKDLIIALVGRPVVISNRNVTSVKMPDNIFPFELTGITENDLITYLSKTWGNIFSESFLNRIIKITEGNPLLIRLVFDQANKDRAEITQIIAMVGSTQELRRKLASYYVIPTSANQLIWIMAYFKRRFTKAMLQYLISHDDTLFSFSEFRFDNLQTKPFFKEYSESGSHLLHDEMQVIINEYVIPEIISVDSDWELLRKLILDQYYPQAFEKLDSDDPYLAMQFRAEHFAYLLEQMPIGEPTHPLYEDYLVQIEQTNNYDFEELLWGMVREYLYRFENNGYELASARGERLIKYGFFNKAIEHYQEMDLIFPEKTDLFDEKLGFVYLRIGETEKAINILENTLTKFPKEAHDKLADIENTLGQVKLSTGKWDQAIDHFTTAISHYTKTKDLVGLAGPYINRSYIYSLKGQYDDGVLEAAQAIRLLELSERNDFESTREKIYAYMNMGTAKRHAGQNKEADIHYRKSLEIARTNDDNEGQCYALQQVGINNAIIARKYRLSGQNLSEGINLLSEAFEVLSKSIFISSSINWMYPQGDALSRLAKVFEETHHYSTISQIKGNKNFKILQKKVSKYELGFESEYQHLLFFPGKFKNLTLLEKAARLFEISALVADHVNNFHRALDSLMEFSRVLVDLKQFEIIDRVKTRTANLKRYDHQEDLFSSMSDITLADVKFEQGNHKDAMNLYASSFAKLANERGYASYLLSDRLKLLEKRINNMTKEEQIVWSNYLINEWQQEFVSKNRPDMIRSMEKILINAI